MASVPPPQFQSNYPRTPGSGPLGPGYQRFPRVYWDTIGLAWQMIQANMSVYVVSSILVLVITAAMVGAVQVFMLGAMTAGSTVALIAGSVVAGLIQALVSAFLLVGFICLGVRHARGEYIQIGDIFQPFRNFGPTAGVVAALVVSQVPGLIGSALLAAYMRSGSFGLLIVSIVFLVLGFLIFLGCYGPILLAATHSAMTGAKAPESLSEAFSKVRSNILSLGFLTMAAMICSGLGVFACCIGMVVTYPIAPNVLALHYTYYFPLQPLQEGWNQERPAGS